MTSGIVTSPDLINSLILLAVDRGQLEIYSRADLLPDVRRFFDSDPLFKIVKIEHVGDYATIFFDWRINGCNNQNDK